MTEYSALLVLSTHLIEEIANLLEDIIIIDQGKLIRAESIETNYLHSLSKYESKQPHYRSLFLPPI